MTTNPQEDKYSVYIANPHTKPKIEQACCNAGLEMPHIDTPESIMKELSTE